MYHFSKKISGSRFEDVEKRVTENLKAEGFGVLTEIDVTATLKKKIDVDFRPYKILGACNPQFAFKALSSEDKIGVFLPCNVVIQDNNGVIEVSAVDPVASMMAVNNPQLESTAIEVRQRLLRVIESL